MIYKMEVVPWTDNLDFIGITDLHENQVAVEIPRALIETSRNYTDSAGTLYLCLQQMLLLLTI